MSKAGYVTIGAGIGAGVGAIIASSFWSEYGWAIAGIGAAIGYYSGSWLAEKRGAT